MWATHLSLVVAAFCSRPRLQFVVIVEGVLDVIRRKYLVPEPAVFFFYFFDLFFRLVILKNILEELSKDCLLLIAAAVFVLFRYFSCFFLRQRVCTRAA